MRPRLPTLRLLSWLVLLAGVVASHAFILRGEAMVSRDLARIFIPDSQFERESLLAGELPLWNPLTLLGQPFAAGPLQQAFYPPRIIPVLLFGPIWGLTVEHLLHVIIAAWGAYAAARRLGALRPGALLSGALLGLGTLVSRNDMLNLSGALAWGGWMVAAAAQLGRTPGWRPVARLAAFTAVSALTGLPESLLWQGPACVLAAASASRRPSARTVLRVFAGGLWGLGLAAFTVVPAFELAAYSNRAAHAQSTEIWADRWVDLLALVVRGANRPMLDILREQGLVLGLDIGVVGCALVLLGLVGRRRRRRTLPLLAFSVLLLLLSLGAHFAPADALLGTFPFRLFRYPVKYGMGGCLLVSVLAGPALSRLAALAGRRRARPGAAALLFPALLLAAPTVAWATAGMGLRQGFYAGLLPTALLLALAGAAWLAAPGLGRRRARNVAWALLAVGLADMALAQVTTGKLLTLPAAVYARPSPTAAAIPAGTPSRVSVNMALEWPPSTFDQIPPGLSERYLAASRDALLPNWSMAEGLEALEASNEPRPGLVDSLVGGGAPPRGLYDLVGVEWYVRRERPPFPDLEWVAGPRPMKADPFERLVDLPQVYRSRSAMPRAFVVHEARAASDAEASAALYDEAQPFRRIAFLSLGAGQSLPETEPCAGSSAKVVSRRPREVEVEVEACGKGVLVVTDAWYPGWRARVDGQTAPVLRTDYLVRGIPVPAGKHRVVLRFAPLTFTAGVALSLVSLAAAVAVAWPRRRRA